jgi:hypothetical protein
MLHNHVRSLPQELRFQVLDHGRAEHKGRTLCVYRNDWNEEALSLVEKLSEQVIDGSKAVKVMEREYIPYKTTVIDAAKMFEKHLAKDDAISRRWCS